MYFILVRPGPTGPIRQSFTKEHAVHPQHLCQQDLSAFLLIFETIGEAEAFEPLKDNSLMMEQVTQGEFASLASGL